MSTPPLNDVGVSGETQPALSDAPGPHSAHTPSVRGDSTAASPSTRSTRTHELASVALILALTRVWSRIRELHPQVPGVVILAAPAARGKANVLGHFAALRWNGRRCDGQRFHEVVVVAEHLRRSAEEVAETLLHEAAHALNYERGLFDCSASQYHNRNYRDAAVELGLAAMQVRHYGFSRTSLPPATAALYSDEIEALKAALIHRRSPTGTPSAPTGTDHPTDGGGRRSRSLKATCACPFIIRASKSTFDATVIVCTFCGEPFRLA